MLAGLVGPKESLETSTRAPRLVGNLNQVLAPHRDRPVMVGTAWHRASPVSPPGQTVKYPEWKHHTYAIPSVLTAPHWIDAHAHGARAGFSGGGA